MSKKVYIAGKIGKGAPSEATLRKFAKAEEYIKAKGYKVFNPTTSGLGTMADAYAKACGTNFYTEILLLDIMELKKCDIICLLPDWGDSPGAKAELFFAEAIGLKVRYMVMYGGEVSYWH